VDDNVEVEPKDISYVHSFYAPLTARVVEYSLKPLGWLSLKSVHIRAHIRISFRSAFTTAAPSARSSATPDHRPRPCPRLLALQDIQDTASPNLPRHVPPIGNKAATTTATATATGAVKESKEVKNRVTCAAVFANFVTSCFPGAS